MAIYLFVLALFAANSKTVHAAVVSRLRSNSVRKDEQAVCISIEAFEEPAWIDALIDNVHKFNEPSTRVVLHLNALTNYSESDIKRWNNKRVITSRQRVEVKKFKGSVLNGHLLNVYELRNTWPGVCSHVVLQASNMLWVRRGMEEQVRKRDYAQLRSIRNPNYHMVGHPFYESMRTTKGLHGWGQPEGSFFPMKTMLDFLTFSEQEYAVEGFRGQGRIDAISQVECFIEEMWLQTFALNRADPPPPEEALKAFPICYRGSLLEESLDIGDVKRVAYAKKGLCGNGAPWTDFYSVKRVARDFSHPVTKFILYEL